MPPNPKPRTAAERQAKRRDRRKEEMTALRAALIAIAQQSTDPKARAIALRAITKETE